MGGEGNAKIDVEQANERPSSTGVGQWHQLAAAGAAAAACFSGTVKVDCSSMLGFMLLSHHCVNQSVLKPIKEDISSAHHHMAHMEIFYRTSQTVLLDIIHVCHNKTCAQEMNFNEKSGSTATLPHQKETSSVCVVQYMISAVLLLLLLLLLLELIGSMLHHFYVSKRLNKKISRSQDSVEISVHI